MLLKIEKKGNRYIIVNDPQIKYEKFDVQISENDIIDRSEKGNKKKRQQISVNKILKLRKKYPELKAMDDLTSDWSLHKQDDDLLDEFFNQRAKDEGLI